LTARYPGTTIPATARRPSRRRSPTPSSRRPASGFSSCPSRSTTWRP